MIGDRSIRVTKFAIATTRYRIDWDSLNDTINEGISDVMGGFDTFEQSAFTSIIRVADLRRQGYRLDIEHFSDKEVETLMRLCDKTYYAGRQRPSGLELTFEVKLKWDKTAMAQFRQQKQAQKRPQPPEVDARNNSTPASGQTRGSRLQEQHDVRIAGSQAMAKEALALTRTWQCADDNCVNYKRYCYIEAGKHYRVSSQQHEVWAGAIAIGDATLYEPPSNVHGPIKAEGPCIRTNRNGLRGTPKKGSNPITELVDSMTTMISKQAEVAAMSTAVTVQKDIQEFNRQYSQLGAQGLHTNQQRFVPQEGSQQTLVISPPRPRAVPPSSPISRDDSIDAIIESFFDWMLSRVTNLERRAKVQSAIQIARDQLWTLDDLKGMEDRDSYIYREAVEAGVPSSLARSFRQELRAYKQIYRQQTNLARAPPS